MSIGKRYGYGKRSDFLVELASNQPQHRREEERVKQKRLFSATYRQNDYFDVRF